MATIVIVAYNGVTKKVRIATLQSDISNNISALEVYNATNGSYPSGDGSTVNDGRGFITSGSNTIAYHTDSNQAAYCVESVGVDSIIYVADNAHQVPISGSCSGVVAAAGSGVVVKCATSDVGDIGQGGGAIFYKDTTTTPATCYEAAPKGWYALTAPNDPQLQRGCRVPQPTLPVFIGAGRSNTDYLVADCASVSATYPTAATVSVAFRGGGFNDWYLPSYDEAMQLMSWMGINDNSRVGTDFYWTSTDGGGGNPGMSMAYWVAFYNGAALGSMEFDFSFSVLPVRSLSD